MASIACLCGCGRIGRTRGLAIGCYNKVALQVKAGTTTWAKEIKAGRARDPKAPHERADKGMRGLA